MLVSSSAAKKLGQKKIDGFVKSPFYLFSSFPRKRESSPINPFWAPASAGATAFVTFCEIIKIWY